MNAVAYIIDDDTDVYQGLYIATSFGVAALVAGISLSCYFYIQRRMGAILRSATMMIVCDHTLSLSLSAQTRLNVGNVLSLLTIDSEKLFLATQYVHLLYLGPAAILIALVLIALEVGMLPTLALSGFVAFIIILQYSSAVRIGALRRQMAAQTDKRVRLTSDLIHAIRVAKLTAVEGALCDRIDLVRAAELKALSPYLRNVAFLAETLYAFATFAGAVLFLVWVAGEGGTASTPIVFRLLSLLVILKAAVFLFGMALRSSLDGRVSVRRIEEYLSLQTATLDDPSASQRQASQASQVSLQHAFFSWMGMGVDDERRSCHSMDAKKGAMASYGSLEQGDKASLLPADKDGARDNSQCCLHDVTFSTVSSNELVAIVGSVGSGKSAFISAVLGELSLMSGSRQRVGRAVYSAQLPWIQNRSLRDNVLFGADYADPSVRVAYEQCLRAAELVPDLAALPDGDLTESKYHKC
jgi:ABC-type multidrug transport system fused ATPase/permease subunit